MHRLLRHLRSLIQIGPGRPALWAGLRAGLATVLPLVVASLLGWPAGFWMGIAGFSVTLADKGGAYRTRAKAMGSLTLLAALAAGVGGAVGTHPWLSVAVVLVGVTLASYARCYGEGAGLRGMQVSVMLVIALALPEPGFAALAQRVGFVAVGGLWAMLLSLGLWPLAPYRPARRAVAEVYRVLAFTAEDLARRVGAGAGPTGWAAHSALRHARLRPSIEAGRAALAATRLGQTGESRRGEHLLVLLESADLTGTVLIALSEVMEAAEGRHAYVHARAEVQRLSEAYGRMARWVVQALEREQDEQAPRMPRRAADTLVTGPQSHARPHPTGPVPGYVAALLDTLRSHASVARESALGLLRGEPVSERGRSAVGPHAAAKRVRRFAPLRDHLGLDSPVLRHALRVGLVASVATLLTHALELDHGYWVTATVLVLLQPYAASTEQRTVQRMVGTLLGASIAALVATFLHAPLGMLLVIFLLTGAAVALLPLNYGLGQLLLTPAFVLLAEMGARGQHLAGTRVLNTLLGGALALLGAWLLWPSPERRRFPELAAAALRADGAYLREVAEHPGATDPAVRSARRHLGRTLVEAEASFQRLVAEYHGPPEALEPAMALLTYARRFAAAVTTLSVERSRGAEPEALRQLAHAAGEALEALAQALSEQRTPEPLRPLSVPAAHEDALYGALLERVPRQLGVLHGAVARLTREVPLQRGRLDGAGRRRADGSGSPAAR